MKTEYILQDSNRLYCLQDNDMTELIPVLESRKRDDSIRTIVGFTGIH